MEIATFLFGGERWRYRRLGAMRRRGTIGEMLGIERGMTNVCHAGKVVVLGLPLRDLRLR
jgi:hypothetical protein